MQRIHEALILSADEVGVQVRTDGRAKPTEEKWVIMKRGADTKIQAVYLPEKRGTNAVARKGYSPMTTIRMNVLMSAGGEVGRRLGVQKLPTALRGRVDLTASV